MAVRDLSAWSLGIGVGNPIRTGQISLTSGTSSIVVPFDSSFSGNLFNVFFERGGPTITTLAVSNKTVSGFTLTLTSGVSEIINYTAIFN